MMKTILAAGALATMTAFAAPAQAGNVQLHFGVSNGPAPIVKIHDTHRHYHKHHHHGYEMSNKQVRRSLRHRGFYKIRIVKRRPGVAVVKAYGPRGNYGRFRVDTYNGRILRAKVLRYGHRHYGHRHHNRNGAVIQFHFGR